MSDTAALMLHFGLFCILCGYALGCYVMAKSND